MKKILVMMCALIFAISFIVAANGSSAVKANAQSANQNNEIICCKIYGLGAYMEEVNVEYKLMKRNECAVSEEFVGGGREIVENKLCKKELTPEQVQNIIRVRNRLRAYYANESECPNNCTCAGSTVKCQLQNGTREMTIHAGNSGNTIVQVKNYNASTKVQLYKSDDGKVYAQFRNNQTKEIILPDEAKERIEAQLRERVRLHNENITLNEDGEYYIQARKQARLFWIVPVKEKVRVRMDAETGEIIRTRTSWWGFLARDIPEDVNETEAQ